MRVLKEGREYQIGSMHGTEDQTITFFQRKPKNLTNRELHEEKAGEELPEYFFDAMGIDPDADSGVTSDSSETEELDGTTVDELVKVLIAQFNHYQETVPCSENEESIEALKKIQALQMERVSNRRVNRTFATLES